MITRNDCYLLLAEINEKGIDTSAQIKSLMSSTSIPLDINKFNNIYSFRCY